MNERILELAEQAGFVTWSDEEWKPKGAVIDWANDYDKELEKFAELIRADEREACAKLCDDYPHGMGLTERQLAQAIRARG